jgi:hypothetical protein
MIVSVHIADVGPLRALRLLFRRPRIAEAPGMISAEPTITAPLGTSTPRPNLSQIGLIAASIGFARPALPRLVSTFSIWRSAAAMRAYAFDSAGSHQAAVQADRARPFHHESAFVRFRPYASEGSRDGRNPLAAV